MLSMLGSTRASVITLQDFTGVSDGTVLTTLPGWSLQAGSDSATVSATAGYSGPGASVGDVSQYKYAVPAEDTQTVSSSIAGYSVKLQLGGTNNYQQAQVLLGKHDGVNGLAVVFNGGTANTDADNFIQISSGGTSWGSVTYTSLDDLHWVSNDWYQVDFSNIALASSGFGSAVTGSVTITDLTSGTVLLSDQPITGFGSSGTFDTIDQIIVGNKSVSRALHFDDLAVTVVPEPAALSLLGLACLALPAFRRGIRKLA